MVMAIRVREPTTMPTITIAVPVFNGAAEIETAIRCILDGTYRDFTMVVSDNGSTDGTAEIVQRIADEDPRVLLIRQPENLGAVGNFEFLAEYAETDFILFRAHDDLSAPDYIERLAESLATHSLADLVAPAIETQKPGKVRQRPMTLNTEPDRYAGVAQLGHVQAAWVYGLWRTAFIREAVPRVRFLFPHLYGWDMLLILDCLLGGRVTGARQARFIQQFGPGRPQTARASRTQNWTLTKEFRRAAHDLANHHDLSTMQHAIFTVMLERYIFTKVVRWQRLVKG